MGGDWDRRPTAVQAIAVSGDLPLQLRDGVITNGGAIGTVAIRLPKASYSPGLEYRFVRTASQAFRLVPATGDQFLKPAGTLTTASKYRELGSDGAMHHVISDGTRWVVLYERGTINDEG